MDTGAAASRQWEVVVTGILVALGLRLGAGALQALVELAEFSGARNVLNRVFAQVGSTAGILTLAAVLVVVWAPPGALGSRWRPLVTRVAGGVAVLGLGGALFSLGFSVNTGVGRLTLAMINGLSAATLAGTGWWVARHPGDRGGELDERR